MNEWELFVENEPRFKNASINQLTTVQKRAIVQQCVKSYSVDRVKRSFALSGVSGTGKNFVLYAYLRELYKYRLVEPKRIKIISEAYLARVATAGFEKGTLLKELFAPKNSIFVVDAVGYALKFGYGSEENELARMSIWTELVEHVYSNLHSLVIITPLSRPALRARMGDFAFGRFESISHGFYTLKNRPEFEYAHKQLNSSLGGEQ